MTAKQTAQELTQQYYDEVTNHMTWYEAKQCAYIACDTIISAVPKVVTVRQFWKEVQKEIEKL